MIGPNDIDLDESAFDINQRKDIESYIDTCILNAIRLPIYIASSKQNWSAHNINAVLLKYRLAGWYVDTTSLGYMAVLSRHA